LVDYGVVLQKKNPKLNPRTFWEKRRWGRKKWWKA